MKPMNVDSNGYKNEHLESKSEINVVFIVLKFTSKFRWVAIKGNVIESFTCGCFADSITSRASGSCVGIKMKISISGSTIPSAESFKAPWNVVGPGS